MCRRIYKLILLLCLSCLSASVALRAGEAQDKPAQSDPAAQEAKSLNALFEKAGYDLLLKSNEKPPRMYHCLMKYTVGAEGNRIKVTFTRSIALVRKDMPEDTSGNNAVATYVFLPGQLAPFPKTQHPTKEPFDRIGITKDKFGKFGSASTYRVNLPSIENTEIHVELADDVGSDHSTTSAFPDYLIPVRFKRKDAAETFMKSINVFFQNKKSQ